MHYLDVRPAAGEDHPIALLLHGEPSWSFLYRHMIPVLVAAGVRCIAPDLVGFGKSDKLPRKDDYSYGKHIDWVCQLIEGLDLRSITLVCQDWGGLIGLRCLTRLPGRFARAVVANTGLPTGDKRPSTAFMRWQKFAAAQTDMPIGVIVSGGCARSLSQEVVAAYDAPFPAPEYKAGAHVFPALVPTAPTDPEAAANTAAWAVLRDGAAWGGQIHVAFSDLDAVTKGAEAPFLALPRCASSTVLQGGGHFLQEDVGPAFAAEVIRAMGLQEPRAKL